MAVLGVFRAWASSAQGTPKPYRASGSGLSMSASPKP